MFGLDGEKLLVIAVIAVILIGPQRLPPAAQWLRKAVATMRTLADTASDRARAELGDEIDWVKLDPRQYDPRRIIRDALLEQRDPVARADTDATDEAKTIPTGETK